MNRITNKSESGPVIVDVAKLPGGTIVYWPPDAAFATKAENDFGGYFVTVQYKDNPAGIAAVGLKEGGYLNSGTHVRVVHPGTTLELVAGGR